MDLSSMMASDATTKELRVPTNEELQTVQELVDEQLALERSFQQAEETLRQVKEQLALVREFKLPNALELFGLKVLGLANGAKVTIKEDVYAAITEENREAAFEWLEATDNDGIIKNEVKCPFGKGQDEEAKALTQLLQEHGYSFSNSRSIHTQTLKAFCQNQMQAGLPIPTDIFSIHPKRTAVIELPKKPSCHTA